MPEHPTRDDNETTTTRCPICRTPFIAVRRQRYCTNACRQIAYRRRHHTADPAVVLDPPAASRRDHTIYACSECDQRYLGQQWCPNCQHPCRRIGPGGICPHCDEPVAINEITGTREEGATTT